MSHELSLPLAWIHLHGYTRSVGDSTNAWSCSPAFTRQQALLLLWCDSTSSKSYSHETLLKAWSLHASIALRPCILFRKLLSNCVLTKQCPYLTCSSRPSFGCLTQFRKLCSDYGLTKQCPYLICSTRPSCGCLTHRSASCALTTA